MREPLPSVANFQAVPLKDYVYRGVHVPESKVKVINRSNNPLPKYESLGAAGMDICANLSPPEITKMIIYAGKTKLVPTGIFLAVQPGYEIQVRPRSGLSLKTNLRVANSPGTVDSDYRGEIKVIMTNIGETDEIIKQKWNLVTMQSS